MKLIKPSFEILESQGSLKDIERAARICYQSQDKISEDDSSAKILVANLIKREHFAMLEFGQDICLILANIELIIFIDLFIEQPFFKVIDFLKVQEYGETIVIINPRTAIEIFNYLDSINLYEKEDFEAKLYNTLLFLLPKEISNLDEGYDFINRTIFSSYTGDLKQKKKVTVRFICDRGISHELVRHRLCSFAQKSTRYCDEKGDIEFIEPCWDNNEYLKFEGSLANCEYTYKHLRKNSYWKPEQARAILPNALATEIIVKTSLQEWKHIFGLRCDKAAHPQMREIMIPLREEFIKQGYINE